jgi:poly-D-alanine transfer protein DltD
MIDLLEQFINNEDAFVPTLIATAIVLCVVVNAVTSMFSSIARERTRREIAAYIAEGSMTPEQGERLLMKNKRDRACH